MCVPKGKYTIKVEFLVLTFPKRKCRIVVEFLVINYITLVV